MGTASNTILSNRISDESLDKNGNAGAGYNIFRGCKEILYGQIPLGRTAHSYDTELIGATEGLRAASSYKMV